MVLQTLVKQSALKTLESRVIEVLDFSMEMYKDDESLYNEIYEEREQTLSTVKMFIKYCEKNIQQNLS